MHIPARKRVRFLAAVGLAFAASGVVVTLARSPQPAVPSKEAVITSTRQVNSLAVGPDGALWAGTAGGILRRGPEGSWRKFTRLDGLPSHEVRAIQADSAGVNVFLPVGAAKWTGEGWKTTTAAKREGEQPLPAGATCETEWQGQRVAGGVTDLRLKDAVTGKWRVVTLPVGSRGTHVSALLPRDNTLWVALFGEGLWSFDGTRWTALEIGLPEAAREVTALAADGEGVWVGTRREGLWEYRDSVWTQHLQPDEPYDHNCQSIAAYQGDLYVTTLDEGLVIRTRSGWRHETPAVLSSVAPRQMVEFQGALYVRHGNGGVDRLVGEEWKGPAFALPRKEASALATDGQRLYVGQWGGWSEWDGQRWTHHLNRPALQGLSVTCLLPDGDTLWIGTQSRGLAEADRKSEHVRWHDERHGLPDDWITSLARVGGTVYAGTFVGGLACRQGERWVTAPELSGQNVTALGTGANSTLFIATRTGTWRKNTDGQLRKLSVPYLDSEAQALCPVDGGLWVGTRTSLAFLREGESLPVDKP
jgi:ligand-binding sensor domain-containing protein